MAEKGILITNQTGGNSIACRDANALDQDLNPRVIQRLCETRIRIPSPLGPPTRAGVTANDSFDLENLSADITDNLIDMGDKSKVTIITEFGQPGGSCRVSLMIFDNEASPAIYGKIVRTSFSTGFWGQDFSINSGNNGLGGAVLIDLENNYSSMSGVRRLGILISNMSGAGTGHNIWVFPV